MVFAMAILAMLSPDAAAAAEINWWRSLGIGLIAAVISFLLSLLSYYQGDKLVLAVSGAGEIQHADDPELFNVVEEMAIAAGVPMPKVYLIHDPAPNAFATGRNPQHASVCVTSGLRGMMTRDELQGVLAHEMSHVRNYDIRLMLMMSVMIGTIAVLADVFWQMLRFGGGGRSSSSGGGKGGGKGGGAIILVIFIVAVLLAILAPLLAQIIELAVSRQREYLADASGRGVDAQPARPGERLAQDRRRSARSANGQSRHGPSVHRQPRQEVRIASRLHFRQPSAHPGSHRQAGSARAVKRGRESILFGTKFAPAKYICTVLRDARLFGMMSSWTANPLRRSLGSRKRTSAASSTSINLLRCSSAFTMSAVNAIMLAIAPCISTSTAC